MTLGEFKAWLDGYILGAMPDCGEARMIRNLLEQVEVPPPDDAVEVTRSGKVDVGVPMRHGECVL